MSNLLVPLLNWAPVGEYPQCTQARSGHLRTERRWPESHGVSLPASCCQCGGHHSYARKPPSKVICMEVAELC